MRRWLTILIWLGVLALTCGVLWGVTIGWRPAEFEDIYARRSEVRLAWARDYERTIREQFIPKLRKGEPFTLTLSQAALNGLLSQSVAQEKIRLPIRLDEPQIACRDGWIVFMTRARQAGGAIASAEIRLDVPEPGFCRAVISEVRIGSVPLDEGFVREKAARWESVARRLTALADRVAKRASPHEARIRQNAAVLDSLVALLRGEPVAARGEIGQGLSFSIERIRIEPGFVRLEVVPWRPASRNTPAGVDGVANAGEGDQSSRPPAR